MDIIFIKGLTILTVIGIHPWERRCLQKIIIDLDIAYNCRGRIYNNNMKGYLNYEEINLFVNMLVSTSCFFLLESLAEIVAEELMLNFSIPWIRVSVSKPGALNQDVHVGVIIERKKDDYNNVIRL